MLFLLLGICATNAAFPTVKATNKTATVADAIVVTTTTTQVTTVKAAKRELKAAAANAKFYGGGKSKIIAALLAIFLGVFGVHSFYMGQTTKGFLQLGLTALGLGLYVGGIASYVSGAGVAFPVLALLGLLIYLGVGIWALVDFVRILTGSLEPEEGFDD